MQHTGVDGGCSSRRISHIELPEYDPDNLPLDQGIVGGDGLPKADQFAKVSFNS